MKRQEFIDEVCYWYQLIDFCSDEGAMFAKIFTVMRNVMTQSMKTFTNG